MEQTKALDPALLEEYKSCRETVEGLDRNIWQTATIFTVGSVVALAAFVKDVDVPSANAYVLFASFVLGLVAIGLLVTWYRLAWRWDSVKYAMLLRMEAIERESTFRANTYARLVDRTRENTPRIILCWRRRSQTQEEREQEERIEREEQEKLTGLVGPHSVWLDYRTRRQYEYRGIRPMLKFAVWISVSAWLVLVVIPAIVGLLLMSSFSLSFPRTTPEVAFWCLVIAVILGLFFLGFLWWQWNQP